MAEELTFWVCSCGRSNQKRSKKCVSCKKRRPIRRQTYAVLIVLVVLSLSFIFASDKDDIESANQLPESQKQFLSTIEEAYVTAAGSNSLVLYETLNDRNIKLKSFAKAQDWIGTVVGIEEMKGKGAISINLGGPRIVAGEHLFYGLNTLIPKEKQEIYNLLISATNGDRVLISGEFVIHNQQLVDLNYTNYGSLDEPKFLFDFTSISILEN